MMRIPLPLLVVLPVLLAGCIDVPALDAAVSDQALSGDRPVLVSTSELLKADAAVRLEQEDAQALAERAENLRARAAQAADPVDRQDLQQRAEDLQRRADALQRQP